MHKLPKTNELPVAGQRKGICKKCLQSPKNPKKPFADRTISRRQSLHTQGSNDCNVCGGPSLHHLFEIAEWKFHLLAYLTKRRHQRLVRVRYLC